MSSDAQGALYDMGAVQDASAYTHEHPAAEASRRAAHPDGPPLATQTDPLQQRIVDSAIKNASDASAAAAAAAIAAAAAAPPQGAAPVAADRLDVTGTYLNESGGGGYLG